MTAREMIEIEAGLHTGQFIERDKYVALYQSSAERVIDKLVAENDQLRYNLRTQNNLYEIISKLEAERDAATAAHVLCDRKRQAALDRVRELEGEVVRLSDIDKETYRDRLDRMVAARRADGESDITNAIAWSVKCLAAVDAEVEGREK